MDPRTEPSAAFALRLAADLLTAMVITGALSKAAASALVSDSLAAVAESHPEHVGMLEEIAATVAAQVGLTSLAAEGALRKDT